MVLYLYFYVCKGLVNECKLLGIVFLCGILWILYFVYCCILKIEVFIKSKVFSFCFKFIFFGVESYKLYL